MTKIFHAHQQDIQDIEKEVKNVMIEDVIEVEVIVEAKLETLLEIERERGTDLVIKD
jgi:hypothetical protein